MNPHTGPDRDDATTDTRDADLLAPPPARLWDEAPAPGRLRRFLFRLAGVDTALARTCPPDEQHQIARVGAAVLFGATLQALLVFAAGLVIFGTGARGIAGAVVMTTVIIGVLLGYDTLFVASDWLAQGAAYAREEGIACAGGTAWKRGAGLAMRWLMSFVLASTLAVFLLLKLFAPDIATRWEKDNRAANAQLLEAASARYDAMMGDLRTRLTRSDRHLDALAAERAQLLHGQAELSGANGQMAGLVARIARLEAAKAQARAKQAEYRTSATAEIAGARLSAGNTGEPGAGRQYAMYQALADQQAELVRGNDAEIAAARRDLAALRAARDGEAERSHARFSAGLAEVDRQLPVEQANRAALARELQTLEGGRAAWVNSQLRANPRYVAVPTGLVAQVQTLWALAAANPGLAALMFGLKIATILLETAGMLTKAFFTRCRVYALRAALRAHDACRAEAELREGWAAWRLRRQDQREAVVEEFEIARRRRATRQFGAEMAHSQFRDRFSA